MANIDYVRNLFPITRQTVPVLGSTAEVPLIFFDHGASTHPPQPVLDAFTSLMEHTYSNVHRAQHYLSQRSTDLFEDVYAEIFNFISGTREENSVVLTSNTTGALDLAAHVMRSINGATLVTSMEHHSNDLPHRRRGEVHRSEICADGSLDYADMERILREHHIKLVAVSGGSNVTGYLPDLNKLARLAHAHGAKLLVDAAQLLAHRTINVLPNSDPGHIDFLAAAGHKAYAPFGSAFLFGPTDILNDAPPYMPGGGTAIYVTDDAAYWAPSPDRHQGGTPNIGGAVAMGAALKFLSSVGMENIRAHEVEMTSFVLNAFSKIDGVNVLGSASTAERLGVIAFNIDGVRHDLVSAILNQEAGIATRNGRFCAHPYVMRLLGLDPNLDIAKIISDQGDGAVPGAVRATFGIYNTMDEVAELVRMVKVIRDKKWIGHYEIEGPASGCAGNVFTSVIEV